MRFLSCVCVSSNDGVVQWKFKKGEKIFFEILISQNISSSNLNDYTHNLHLLIAFNGLNKDSSNYVAQCKFNSLFLSSIRQKRNLSSTMMHFFCCFVLLSLFHQPIFFFIQKQNNQDQGRKLLLLGATGLTHQQYYACILNLLSSEVLILCLKCKKKI